MKIGTKSVLYGAHCFFLHPFFVAAAWTKLYGFPLDPRIWIAFFVHDLGYLGKPNMDGPEGETHVELGAKIMHLFDFGYTESFKSFAHEGVITEEVLNNDEWEWVDTYMYEGLANHITFRKVERSTKWRDFSMFHSRYYAKKHNAQPSKLCFADKLAFALTPRWLYLPMVNATGEIKEYLKNAQTTNEKGWTPVEGQVKWHKQLCEYMIKWVDEHKDGRVDTWTNQNRHATESGVTL